MHVIWSLLRLIAAQPLLFVQNLFSRALIVTRFILATTTLPLTVLTLAISACSFKTEEHSHNEQQGRIVEVGDPMALIAGATFNSQYQKLHLANSDKIYLLYMDVYRQKLREVPSSENPYSKLMKDQTPKKDAELNRQPLIPCQISVEQNVQLNCQNKTNLYNFTLTDSPTALGQEAFIDHPDGKKNKAQLLHVSESKSKNIISLLFLEEDSLYGKQLRAVYFAKSWPATSPYNIIGDNFYYLFGIGVKVGWPKNSKQNLYVCTQNEQKIAPLAFDAVNKWNDALAGRLKIETKVIQNYPPFSDLNTKCIYYVDDYLLSPYLHIQMYGTTTVIADDEIGQFIDSDIFIFQKEIDKIHTEGKKLGVSGYQIKTVKAFNLEYTIAHEIGHFLGLHHRFDNATTSIMSYDLTRGSSELTDYDINAAKALYE